MRLLVDLTNSPHVPFFAPLVRSLRGDGHEVLITARRFAQTVELAELHGLEPAVIGRHGGTSRIGKGRAALARVSQLRRHARRAIREGGAIDAALSHGSTDLPVVSRMLGIPHVTAFDYEWAATMHHLNCRLSWRVVVPDAIPLERLEQYGAAGKVAAYPGLKEEYYLEAASLQPDRVRGELGIPAEAVLAVLRPPADMALYHRGITNDLFGAVLDRLRAHARCAVVVLPRTERQRGELAAATMDDPRVVIPERALDGASLVAAADLVVSAGGTMNREAAALGVPVYTVFAGRMGGVDERLLADGRLRPLRSAEDVAIERRDRNAADGSPDRDPAGLVRIMLEGLPVVERRG